MNFTNFDLFQELFNYIIANGYNHFQSVKITRRLIKALIITKFQSKQTVPKPPLWQLSSTKQTANEAPQHWTGKLVRPLPWPQQNPKPHQQSPLHRIASYSRPRHKN